MGIGEEGGVYEFGKYCMSENGAGGLFSFLFARICLKG